jgi:hypothetical protein
MASTKTATAVPQPFLDAFNAHDVETCDLLEFVDGKISRT